MIPSSEKLAGAPPWIVDASRTRRRKAGRRVAHHYDLSARLYDLFLDLDRQYSCA